MSKRQRDARELVAKGIYRGVDHWYGIVHVRGAGDLDPKTGKRKAAFREKRFNLSEPITKVEAWQAQTRAQLLEFAERGSAPGSFERDARRYVKDFTTHLASAKSRRLEVDTWIKAFGDKARGAIKSGDVAKVRAQWHAEGLAPKTINNRVNTLRHMYRMLDGKRAWTPCDDFDPMEVHKTPIRFVTNDVILAVDEKFQRLEQAGTLRSSKARARFRVVVSTGRRPSEIMRTEPGDLDLARRVWLPRDGKGGFSPGVYLTDDMLAAWELFIEAKAWGWYNTGRQAQYMRDAGWPEDVKPYNARHTVGITLSEAGADLDDVGAMMGHRRRETTRKHYVPVLNSRMQRTSELLTGRFKGWPTVQTTVQNREANYSKSGPKPIKKSGARTRPLSGKKKDSPNEHDDQESGGGGGS
jgi:integrase